MTVCLSQKYRAKISSDKQAQDQRFPTATHLSNCRTTPPATSAKSQLLSPASFCRHRELVPRRHSLPTGRARSWSPAPFTLCRRKSRSPNPELLSVSASSRAGSQFPSVAGAWGQGNQHSFVPACVQNKLGATSPGSRLPAHPSATSKGGSQLPGATRSCLLHKLSSGFWFSPCQPGTVALLTQGNPARVAFPLPARVEFPLLGKEAGESESRVAWLRARNMSGSNQVNEG